MYLILFLSLHKKGLPKSFARKLKMITVLKVFRVQLHHIWMSTNPIIHIYGTLMLYVYDRTGAVVMEALGGMKVTDHLLSQSSCYNTWIHSTNTQ